MGKETQISAKETGGNGKRLLNLVRGGGGWGGSKSKADSSALKSPVVIYQMALCGSVHQTFMKS